MYMSVNMPIVMIFWCSVVDTSRALLSTGAREYHILAGVPGDFHLLASDQFWPRFPPPPPHQFPAPLPLWRELRLPVNQKGQSQRLTWPDLTNIAQTGMTKSYPAWVWPSLTQAVSAHTAQLSPTCLTWPNPAWLEHAGLPVTAGQAGHGQLNLIPPG